MVRAKLHFRKAPCLPNAKVIMRYSTVLALRMVEQKLIGYSSLMLLQVFVPPKIPEPIAEEDLVPISAFDDFAQVSQTSSDKTFLGFP